MDELVVLARVLTTAVLVGVAIGSLVQWRRRGGEATKWAALTFGVLGSVVLAGRLVPEDESALSELELKLIVAGLVCFPYCLYRFTMCFDESRRQRHWLPAAVTLFMIVSTLLLPRIPDEAEPRPAWFSVYLIAFLVEWTVLSVVSAKKLWRQGHEHPTVVRRRMRLLSVASIGLSLTLAASVANQSNSAGVDLVVELLALCSSILFFTGLIPPRPLLASWRSHDEQNLHRAVEALVAAADRDQVAAALLPNLVAVVGGRGAALVRDGEAMAVYGVSSDLARTCARELERGGPTGPNPDRVTIELRSGCLVIWVSRYTPFFGEAEIEHLRFLGGLLDVALERVRVSELEQQARRALEREKGFSQDLIRSTSDGMLAFDGDLRYTLWNPAMERLTGVPASEVIGELAAEKFPRLRESGGEELFRRALNGEHVTSFERFFAVPETGASGWLDLSCSPIEDESGNVVGGLAVVRDVTFRKQAEELQSHLAAIVDSTDDAILSKDKEGRIISWNKAAERLYGYKSEEMLGMPVSILIPPEREGEFKRILDLVNRGERFERVRTVRRKKNGEVIPVSITVSPIRNVRGEIVAASSTARDISSVIEAEEALLAAKEEAERANKEKSEFLSRMSHELRTPLNAILGFAQLLDMQKLAPEDAESVDHISRAGQHLLELINEVLDISRIETGKLALSLEPVAVEVLVDEALMLVGPLAAERGVDIRWNGDRREGLYARADVQRFKQVALNLLSNAIKYNRQGGTVTVRCEQVDGRVRVVVSDTGAGISASKMDRLYQPFDRLGAEQSGVEGTGLGLALSKGLMEAMGGSLHGKSEVGRGSSFWVELPAVEALPVDGDLQEEPGPAHSPLVDASAFTSTVLYIEDNLMNLRLVERLLENRTSLRLLSAMQGSLGLELARQYKPDLVLLDLNLPDMTGMEVLDRLRAEPSTRGVPVAVVTADASKKQRENLLEAGAFAYVTKPIDVSSFLEVVDEGLRLSVGHGQAAGMDESPPPARVLLVDDDNSTRRLMRLSLELESIEVVGEAQDGSTAVSLARDLRPDVVLMDLRLPVIDGLEATRQIREQAPETQVVIFTGDDDPAVQDRATSAGSYRCLVKGSPPDAVVKVIAEAWRHKLADNPVAG